MEERCNFILVTKPGSFGNECIQKLPHFFTDFDGYLHFLSVEQICYFGSKIPEHGILGKEFVAFWLKKNKTKTILKTNMYEDLRVTDHDSKGKVRQERAEYKGV